MTENEGQGTELEESARGAGKPTAEGKPQNGRGADQEDGEAAMDAGEDDGGGDSRSPQRTNKDAGGQ